MNEYQNQETPGCDSSVGATSAGPVVLRPMSRGNRATGTIRPAWGIGLILALLLTGCGTNRRVVESSEIYVVDGDTIKIGEKTVRLVGFDTPETYQARCNAENALGDQATARVRELIESVLLVHLDMWHRKDKYGRSLATLYIMDDDIGPVLIEEGLARAYNGGQRGSWCC